MKPIYIGKFDTMYEGEAEIRRRYPITRRMLQQAASAPTLAVAKQIAKGYGVRTYIIHAARNDAFFVYL